MGETLPIFSTTFNRAVQIEARADHLDADSGALRLREILERTGIVEWMSKRLVDRRDPNTTTYPLADLLRTSVLLLGQGWRDQDDADRLRHDPSFRAAKPHAPQHRRAGAVQRVALAADDVTVAGRLERTCQSQGDARGGRRTGAAAVVDRQRRRRRKRLMIDVDGLW